MSYILTGFADAGAWMRTIDGDIVGHPRDRSYKEVLRTGIPILYFCEEKSAPKIESVLPTSSHSIPVPVVNSAFCEYDTPIHGKSTRGKLNRGKRVRIDKSRAKRSHRKSRELVLPEEPVEHIEEPDVPVVSTICEEEDDYPEYDYWFYMHYY